MKIRNGFVSNSSSSSFAISKSVLTEEQIDAIYDHINYTKNNFPEMKETSDVHDGSAWGISEDEKNIFCNTFMDNFDMYFFLNEIGIDEKDIHITGDNF